MYPQPEAHERLVQLAHGEPAGAVAVERREHVLWILDRVAPRLALPAHALLQRVQDGAALLVDRQVLALGLSPAAASLRAGRPRRVRLRHDRHASGATTTVEKNAAPGSTRGSTWRGKCFARKIVPVAKMMTLLAF